MRVLCRLENASTLINGVEFFPHELGVISGEIEEDVAAAFLKIEGYVKVLPSGKASDDGGAASGSGGKADRSGKRAEGDSSGK
jgi:hypothetical protein